MMPRKPYPARAFLLLLVGLIAIVALASFRSLGSRPADAQGVNVQISELNCDSNPEVIVIMNQGTDPVPMTGWNLQSDPSSQESLPLSSLGSLAAGGSLLVEAGPAAEAAFVWSRNFVFRDNDPTDFAQLASDQGDVLLKVNCGSVATQATPIATPAPSASPRPSTTPVPTALTSVVPVSGGPVDGGALAPAVALIGTGSVLLLSGLATFAIPWRRRQHHADEAGPESPSAAFLPTPVLALPSPALQKPDAYRQYLFLAAIVLALITLLIFLLQLGGEKRE